MATQVIKGICEISPDDIFIKGGLNALIIFADHSSNTVEKRLIFNLEENLNKFTNCFSLSSHFLKKS